MTLAKKTAWRLSILTAGLLAAGAAAIWCLLMLRNLSATTREEFEELREIRPIEQRLADAALRLAEGRRAAARELLDQTLSDLREFQLEQEEGYSRLDESHAAVERKLTESTVAAVSDLAKRLGSTDSAVTPEDIGLLSAAQQHVNALIAEFEVAVATVHVRTMHRFENVLIGFVIFFLGLTLVAVVINIAHYRSVIGPLRYIRDGVRALSRGALDTRLAPRGDAEFTDLQGDFNAMAAELQSLYDNLEKRVADQGRRLAVSERLASVGFLAAGVAHEINNPLAIIAGYSESLLRRLQPDSQNGDDQEGWRHDLEIIRDEAFRAKKITTQLLDLSRGGDPTRRLVSMRRVVQDVVGILRGSPLFERVKLIAPVDGEEEMMVRGSEAELKQVVLNLAMNAAQAAPREGGWVELRTRRADDWIELCVLDNGCGMPKETIQHAFEPFFSKRHGSRGTGLGLTISHAIVQRHHGELFAESNGPGCGSSFTIRLPAAEEESK
ncbi:MAG: HAMP domain-containing protein [Planctomycetota bacterium]|nr:MAG: HAMP domain-containing protein [Planctomycetota bacterium]